MTRILFKDESYRIIGAGFEVYNEKGHGFLENVYQECLGIEFGLSEVPFEERPRLTLTYKSRILNQEYIPDFLCYGEIIVEIKSVRQILDEHRAQIINYLKATGLSLGLLINFGSHPNLQYERFVNQYSRHPRDS